jgi:flagellar basal-body rod modification protein FlgD
MEVEAIGASLGTQSTTNNNTVSQDDFIKLFLAQLSFQDPLEPVNNEQFLAQMAQFANLEQTRQIAETLQQQTFMQSSDQALTMLGKTVEVSTESGGNVLGTVSAISFSQAGPSITVTKDDNSFINNIKISQVRLVTD